MRRITLVALTAAAVALCAFGAQARSAAAQQAAPSTSTAGEDLRVSLVDLLTEHASLAALAMQKGYDEQPDFEAVTGELDANTVALVTAVRSIFGDQAARAFEQLWRDHIAYLVDYAAGLRMGDAAMQRQAKENLADYVDSISGLLSEALNLPRAAFEQAFQVHVGQLAGALDEYAAGEYRTAYALYSDAHMHMVMTANVLADGIIARFPQRFAVQGGDPGRPPALKSGT